MSGSYAADGSWNATIVNTAAEPIPVTSGSSGPLPIAPFMPQNASPIIEGAFIANATFTVSIPAVAGRTAYLTALLLQSACNIAPAAPGAWAATLNGVVGSASGFLWSIGTNGQGMSSTIEFNPPLPASGQNVAISITIPSTGNANEFLGATLVGFYI